MRETEQNWFNVKGAAKYLSVSTWHIYRATWDGTLKHTERRGQLFYKREDLDAYMEDGVRDVPKVAI